MNAPDRSSSVRSLLLFLLLASAFLFTGRARGADLLDDCAALQTRWDDALLSAYGEDFSADDWAQTCAATRDFAASHFHSPEALALWPAEATAADPSAAPAAAAARVGRWQGNFQHALALEMIAAQQAGRIDEAQTWRSLILLPRQADAVEGALILQRLAAQQKAQEGNVSALLARECLVWQTTRVREKLDYLNRLLDGGQGAQMPSLIAAGVAEVRALADFPPALRHLAPGAEAAAGVRLADFALGGNFAAWRDEVESALPDLLRPEEVARNERMLLKLLHLVPFEYRQAGVREDGSVNVPLEYTHARMFTVQAGQIIDELIPNWRKTKSGAVRGQLAAVQGSLAELEKALAAKEAVKRIESRTDDVTGVLEGQFGLSLQRLGSKESIIDETLLDVKRALGDSLVAAQAGRWADAETARLDAYTSFDLDIEKRALPRDPELALRAERGFLDGHPGAPGVKAALDARLRGTALAGAYERAIKSVEDCASMLKVNISPGTVIITTVSIFAREGLEAVVVLAALLAGLRGPGDRATRRRIVSGAWLAVAATAVTFWLSKSLIQSLSRWGEKLEAVISILAVIILLMVTNWVFHKFYWVGWNAKIRGLSKAARDGGGSRYGETMALLGVGFLTIYREGFETTLFLQSLILDGGLKPVLIGVALGGGAVAAMGAAIFIGGAKLPYRKLLVYTGVLVVGVMAMFLGSTVRLFQTVGWMPIHPITGLEFPAWVGTWLGLYPSWEGILVPMLGLGYVAGAWLWVKWGARNQTPPVPQTAPAAVREPEPAGSAR